MQTENNRQAWDRTAEDPDGVGEGDEPEHALARGLVVEDVVLLLLIFTGEVGWGLGCK